jgi:hypothetical protein
VASQSKLPGTGVSADGIGDDNSRARLPKDGSLQVSEIVSDRAAAPSPFGDDQTFPLPVEELTYTRSTTPE